MFFTRYRPTHKPLSNYESARLRDVAAWKRSESGLSVLAKLLDPIARRAGHAVDRVLPRSGVTFLMERMDDMAERLANDGDELLGDPFVRGFNIFSWTDLHNQPLEVADAIADHVVKDAKKIAIGMGVASGTGGPIAVLGSTPVLLANAMTVIHRVGLSYGYQNTRERRKNLALYILALSMAEDPQQKQVAFADYRTHIQQSLVDQAVRDTAARMLQKLVFGFQVGSAIPGFGIAMNAYLSRAFIKQAGRTAQRVFQEQWLLDHRGAVCV
ncbi:EcsC family protein [Candidatus Methylospira mobilis]|nr:EcsC family protein [Candidatus Methylospira mobilis]WNV03421.1 EcsC family protein [Candidatus Methylospira mobilis]